MTMSANFDQLVTNQVVSVLQVGLDPQSAVPREEIDRAVRIVSDSIRALHPSAEIDELSVCDQVETQFNIYNEAETALRSDEGHEPWLANKRSGIEWKFWDRYFLFLNQDPDFSPRSINRLNSLTDNILDDLEWPERAGSWDRRGLIVGQVQSGKTAAYSGLICKAADAGYKLIVVLAGLSNDLRAQTQERIDEGFVGWDTERNLSYEDKNRRVGVGLLTNELIRSAPLTTAGADGDFSRAIANQQGVIPSPEGAPVLLVVKKNVKILENLYRWATGVIGVQDSDSGLSVVNDVPLMIIDDEADYASINTNPTVDEHGQNDPDVDPTRTNEQIRKLLRSFTKSAYVGFTATPFANVFISESETDEILGRDLFPRHFIRNLKPPTNYIGPRELFGIKEDIAAGIELGEAMPMIRKFKDHDDWVPDGSGANLRHRNGHIPGHIPDSLRRALHSFVLVCAARFARGDTQKHNSMLVHVTRFTSVQREVAEQIQEELTALQHRVRYGDEATGSPIRTELQSLWESDFVPTTRKVRRLRPDLMVNTADVSWSDVNTVLTEASQKIVVKEVNGVSADSLDYRRLRDQGVSVVAVGGDKLSRGLTLDGLSVSYFLRSSMLYDTLMQMGRWFGYRPGYADLCRIFTRKELAQWFKDVTFASEELRVEFDRMEAERATPEQYGLRVRRHPAGLSITSAGKMRRTARMYASYSNTLAETYVLSQDPDVIRKNLAAVESLIINTRPKQKGDLGFAADNVSGKTIAEFFRSYSTLPRLTRTHAGRISDFIAAQQNNGELTDWTVFFRSSQGSDAIDYGLNDLRFKTFVRRNVSDEDGVHAVPNNHVITGRDESRDFSEAEYEDLLKQTKDRFKDGKSPRAEKEPTVAAGDIARANRDVSRGLMLIYLITDSGSDPLKLTNGYPIPAVALSFPKNPNSIPVEYQAGEVWWQQELSL